MFSVLMLCVMNFLCVSKRLELIVFSLMFSFDRLVV